MKESKWVDVINDVIVIPDPKTVCSLLRIYSPLVSRRFEELIQNHQGQRSHQVCLSNRVIFQTELSVSVTSHLCIQQYRFLQCIYLFYQPLVARRPQISKGGNTLGSCVDIVWTLCIGHTAHVWKAMLNCGHRIFAYDCGWSRRLRACPVAGLSIVFEQRGSLLTATMTLGKQVLLMTYCYIIVYLKNKILL